MKKILFIYKNKASWAIRDRDILGKNFELKEFFVTRKGLIQVWGWMGLVLQVDIIFAWFGSIWFLPLLIWGKILGKKLVIVAGGYDVAKDELFHHGSYTHSLIKQKLQTLVFKFADKVICISQSNMKEAMDNALIPEDKIELIEHGFEKPEIDLRPWGERKNKVVMISNVSPAKFYIKGVDQLILIAKEMPEVEFILMGSIDPESEALFKNCPSNLRRLGAMDFGSKSFNDELNSAKIIMQLSHYESFGAAVVDGALRGCYPIVYSQYALSEIVSDYGDQCEYGQVDQLKKLIGQALKAEHNPQEIQDYFFNRYNFTVRENALNTVLKSL